MQVERLGIINCFANLADSAESNLPLRCLDLLENFSNVHESNLSFNLHPVMRSYQAPKQGHATLIPFITSERTVPWQLERDITDLRILCSKYLSLLICDIGTSFFVLAFNISAPSLRSPPSRQLFSQVSFAFSSHETSPYPPSLYVVPDSSTPLS